MYVLECFGFYPGELLLTSYYFIVLLGCQCTHGSLLRATGQGFAEGIYNPDVGKATEEGEGIGSRDKQGENIQLSQLCMYLSIIAEGKEDKTKLHYHPNQLALGNASILGNVALETNLPKTE